jgi:hypothetical protein
MHARVVTFEGSSERMQGEDPGRRFRERVLPTLQQQAGFKGVYVLFNRARGKLLGMTLWESEEAARKAMEYSRGVRWRRRVPAGRQNAASRDPCAGLLAGGSRRRLRRALSRRPAAAARAPRRRPPPRAARGRRGSTLHNTKACGWVATGAGSPARCITVRT